MTRLEDRYGTCARCGRIDRNGHYCLRSWKMPSWLRAGPLRLLAVTRSRQGAWCLHWLWRGDAHEFYLHPSLGTHYNRTVEHRRERAEMLLREQEDQDASNALNWDNVGVE